MLKNKTIPAIIFLLFLMFFIFNICTVAVASDDPIKTVRIYGDYHADIQAALDRINAIRKEACIEGVPDPRDPSVNLTSDDYVEIKWSYDLEEIARLRAAEASIAMRHTRPNGEGFFTITSSNGIGSSGEVLAWNWNDNSPMVNGINQWYGEKSDWVDQDDSAVTGHYTQMIDPGHTYVGLGCFSNEYGIYLNTVAGEFRFGSSLDETRGSDENDTYVDIEILSSYVSSPSLIDIANDDGYEVGNDATFRLAMESSINGGQATVFSAGIITWTSSDPSVATVLNGVANFLKPGSTIINAVDSDGVQASKMVVTTGIAIGATAKSKGSTYKAISADEVTFVKAADTKNAIVHSSVTLNGKTYKVTKLAARAFSRSRIRTVKVVSSHITVIPSNAFKSSRATTVVFGNGVKTVESNAFASSSVTKVTLGMNVKKLEKKAFAKSKVATVIVKTRKLSAARTVAGCFRGSKAKVITIKWGMVGMKYVKKSFTRKNTRAKNIILKR